MFQGHLHKIPYTLDGRGQDGRFQQVAGNMHVADQLSRAERKFDHGPQDQGRGKRAYRYAMVRQ